MINRVNKFTTHSFMRGSRVVGLYRRLGDMGITVSYIVNMGCQ